MNAKPAGNKSTKVLQTKSNNGMLITVAALIAVAVVVLGGIVWMAQRGGEANPPAEITVDGDRRTVSRSRSARRPAR